MRFFNRTRTLGALVSLSIALVVWLVSHDPLGALTVGILGEVVALLIEMHYSLGDDLDDLRRILRLRAKLPGGRPESAPLSGYVDSSLDATANGHYLLAGFAHERIVLNAAEMKKIAGGRMEVGPDLVAAWGGKILTRLQYGGFATALGDLYDFWLPPNRPKDQPAGTAEADGDSEKDYQEQNIDVARRVELTRVFLLTSRNVRLLPEFFHLIDDQKNAGVTVLVAYLDEIPDNLKKDFAIWDNQLVVYVHWQKRTVKGPNGEKIKTTVMSGATYCTSQDELITARNLRKQLEVYTVRWSAVRAGHLQADDDATSRK